MKNTWQKPHITENENDFIFEWWNNNKKLTIYVSPTSVEYVKMWGLDIINEMEDGEIHEKEELSELWNWLNHD